MWIRSRGMWFWVRFGTFFTAILLIGDLDFRFVDNGDILGLFLDRWVDDDLDLLLPLLLFVVADDCDHWWWWCWDDKGDLDFEREQEQYREWCDFLLLWWWLLWRWWSVYLDLEWDLDLDRRNRERGLELDCEVRDLDSYLERWLLALLMIGDRDCRFVDDGYLLFLVLDWWVDDDLDLLLLLLFVVVDDCIVIIKAIGDRRVWDVLLELLFLRLLLFLLEELLLLFLEEEEDSFNR